MTPFARPAQVLLLLVVGCSSSPGGDEDSAGGSGSASTATGSTAAESSSGAETTTGAGEAETTSSGSSGASTGMGPAEPLLPEGFEETLVTAWGCGDLTLHLANPERTIMFTLSWPGLLTQAEGEGVTITWQVGFSRPNDANITLVVQQGSALDAATCRSVSEGPAVVDSSWTATDGFIELQVSPAALSPRGTTGLATMGTSDMQFTRDADGAVVSAAALDVENIHITR